MPKSTVGEYPLNGLVAINKPSGQTSMTILDGLKRLGRKSVLLKEEAVKGGSKPRGGMTKIGQGGTLDPLADGVLDGAIVETAPWEHLTQEDVEGVLDRFRGEILQMPPIYSALKMAGKPLYEYARSNTPLPRPIEARKQIVHELVLESWNEARTEEGGEGHNFRWPDKVLSAADKEVLEKSKKLMDDAGQIVVPLKKGQDVASPNASALDSLPSTAKDLDSSTTDSSAASTSTLPPPAPPSTSKRTLPPTFTLRMSVSSGTYVRSIVHDIGLALNSAAHVVVLTRTRQGEFSLAKGNCVDWSIFKEAVEAEEKDFKEQKAIKPQGKKGKGKQQQKVVAPSPEDDEEMMGNDEVVELVVEEAKKVELKDWEKAVLEKFEWV